MREQTKFPATILNVSHHNFVVGGSDQVFLDLGELLADKGHQVIPFCSQNPRNQHSDYNQYFPTAVDPEHPSLQGVASFIYSKEARRQIDRLLQNERVELAHLHIYYGKLTASILSPLRERSIPIVQTLHDYKLVCPVYTSMINNKPCEACQHGDFWHALPRRCNRNSIARTAVSVVESYVSRWAGAIDAVDHFVGISDFVTRRMIAAGIPAERITTVHNFIDASRYTPSYKAGGYAFYFGRLEEVKGVHTLIECARLNPDINFRIAGTGQEADRLAATVAELKLKNVELLGFVAGRELHKLIANADCAVIPSEWDEPFGLTVVESLALGTPVVASRVGGIPELVTEGEDGLLVAPGDPQQLGSAIRKLTESSRTSSEMGRNGRLKVERDFDKDSHYRKLLAVYEHARRRTA